MAQPYNNRSLFSDYYLEELVSQDSHWKTLKDKAWEFRQRISTIIEKALPGINGDTPEAEVERRFIRPILDVLGHVYFVNPSVTSPEGVRRPDYAFFPSAEARRKAEAHKGQLEFFKTALAVGDAKAWERSLDKRVKGPGDPFTNHNPSYQIDFYLRATDRRWGLLTNGRHWRLYHRDLSYRLDVYYEVDLPKIVILDEDAFLYFLAFFHKDAFQPDAEGRCFLDRAYRASIDYATKVGEKLKDNVYEALRFLAEGFLSFPGNNLSPEDLDLIRENAFVVIYRLLFVFYAEAREFLPVTDAIYASTYSLRALAREIAAKEPFAANLHPTATSYWSRLQELFRSINNSDPILGIPPYNGRLFDDQEAHQHLAVWKIGDRYLAEAIDQLARAQAAGRPGRGFVSYRDLSIRELGSIYERLLEHRLRYATQGVAVVKDDKREKFVPLAELGNRKALKTYPAGSVYLETDKGERKATGSYYTPDYIVRYIVSNTLGPLLEEAKKSNDNLIDAILALKVLDPAMGSGHFLVEATDYLARALVEALGGDTREMEEDEIRWARREVVERCIYGVDLNPLAVDLAKLSLWLSTVSLDKPLNFLDHHLRCGNSLVGARLEELGVLPDLGKKAKQTAITTLAGHHFQKAIASAVSTFQKIAEAPSDSADDIHRKESAYEKARYALSRIKDIADVWTSAYFGNEVKNKDAYERLLLSADQDSTEWPTAGVLTWLDKSKSITEERRFFHWELEFPEVFFNQNGQRLPAPGFDAVVGNPPWLGHGAAAMDSAMPGLFLEGGERLDAYLVFLDRVLQLASQGRGRIGYITPNTYFTNRTAMPLRQYVVAHRLVAEIIDLPKKTFIDAPDVYPAILIVDQGYGQDSYRFGRGTTSEILTNRAEIPYDLISSPQYQLLASTANEYVWGILGELEQRGLPLERFAQFRKGVETGDDSSFLTRGVLSKPEIFPWLHGREIFRYGIDSEGWHVIYGSHLKNPQSPELRTTHKIVIQYVRKLTLYPRVVAALDHGNFFPSYGTVVSLVPLSERIGLYLLSLLNSNLLNFYYKHMFHDIAIKAQYLYVLPIRPIGFTTLDEERELLVGKGTRLYQEHLQTKDWGKVLSFVGQRLPQKPDGSPDTEREQSDVVHDLLAFLAEEMTRLHKYKQAETKGFLTWLEGYLGIHIEDLKNRTKVREYYKDEVAWEGFLNVLEQNRKAIQLTKGVDITRREPQETIRGEFETSIAKLNPILETIDLTDKLIDQIVYKLYGLTLDEIAVVEGQPIAQS